MRKLFSFVFIFFLFTSKRISSSNFLYSSLIKKINKIEKCLADNKILHFQKLRLLNKYRHLIYTIVLKYCIKIQKYHKALKILKKAIAFLPSEIWFYVNSAYCCNSIALYEKSIRFSEKALALARYANVFEKQKILSNLRVAVFNRCRLLEQKYGILSALRFVKVKLRKHYYDYYLMNLTGKLFLRLGKYSKSIEYLKTARFLYYKIYPLRKSEIKLILPFKNKNVVLCVQGNNSGITHIGFDAYAWDFMKVNENFKVHRNSKYLTNSSFYSWKMKVYAPCNGIIVSVINNENDNFYPHTGKKANTVIIKHKSGLFVNLVHFKKNSVVVKVGDRVKKGAFIGLTGNSGFSKSPHLHLMVTDKRGMSIPAYFTNVGVFKANQSGFINFKKVIPYSGKYYKNLVSF